MSRIISIRRGHATNSSSSHSIIAFRKSDDFPEGISERHYEYGWEYFVLDTPEAKARYIVTAYDLHEGHPEYDVIKQKLADYGVDADRLIVAMRGEEYDRDYYIDHESVGTGNAPYDIPLSDWIDILMTDEVAILGGNDNTPGPKDEMWDEGRKSMIDLKRSKILKIGEGSYAFYDPQTGDKFRWSRETLDKSVAPELVDVKITDKCSYGCAFCYQGSTKEGKHAPLSTVKSIIDELAKAGTFEIAIGGGEPTEHPQFVEILKHAISKGVTPNFTTFTDKWINTKVGKGVEEAIKNSKHGIGIGVSVAGEKDLVKVGNIRDALSSVRGAQVIAQTVVGVASAKVTTGLMDMAIRDGHSVLLLGYKETGRGTDFNRKEVTHEDVHEMISHFLGARTNDWEDVSLMRHLSVDTAFLSQYGSVLDKLGIDPVLRTSPEGAFSMYVDAVTMRAGPSSWHPDLMRDLPSPTDIIPMFREMDPIPMDEASTEGPAL